MNSWFEIHYNDPLIPDDYFKEQPRVRKETFEAILNHLNPHLNFLQHRQKQRHL